MSYRLEKEEGLAEDIKRIASEQAASALEQLRPVHSKSNDHDGFVERVDEAIHDARKRFKKIRAVLRLVRDEIGEEIYQAENACYRDAGRLLANLRDSQVMVDTLDDLSDYFSDQIYKKTFSDIRNDLVANHSSQRNQMFEGDAIPTVIATVEQALQRTDTWPIQRTDFDALRAGLRRTYKRGYKRMDEAYADPSPERFHEFRKRVKYHWYHLRILKSLWPDVLAQMADEAHEAANYLGDAHDLAVLEKAVASQPSFAKEDPEYQALIALARKRRHVLEQAAKPIAARVFAEAPDQFIKRMGQYWPVFPASTAS